MRNVAFVARCERPSRLPLEAGDVVLACRDDDNDFLWLATSELCVACLDLASGELLDCAWLRGECEAAGCPISPDAAPVHLSHNADRDELCVGLSDGALLAVPLEAGTLASREVEEVGALVDGLVAGAASPDGELLALLTGAGKVLVFTSDWEVLSEAKHPLRGGDASSAQRAVAGCVSWQSDGKRFSTALQPSAGAQAVGASWPREGGAPEVELEELPGMLPVLAWQPNGRHLYAASWRRGLGAPDAATAAALGGVGASADRPQTEELPAYAEPRLSRHVAAWRAEAARMAKVREQEAAAAAENPGYVSLFERNGLRHGGFDAPGPGPAHLAAWSPSSDVLALAVDDGAGDAATSPRRSRVQLWTRSNWHWDLKAELPLESAAVLLSWGPPRGGPQTLLVTCADGRTAEWALALRALVTRSGDAVVLGAREARVTLLGEAIVPPPLCDARLRLPAAPVCAAALRCRELDPGSLAVALTDGTVIMGAPMFIEDATDAAADGYGNASRSIPEVARFSYRDALQLDSDPLSQAPDAIFFHPSGALCLVAPGGGEFVAMSAETGEALSPPVTLPKPFLAAHGAVVELADGSLWRHVLDVGVIERLDAAFPSPCPSMAVSGAAEESPAAVGLSARGELFLGAALVSKDVTSFAIRHEGPGGAFLLFTTRGERLVALRLEDAVQAAASARDSAEALADRLAKPVSRRAVERAALIVAAPAGDRCEVVLQVPRGNLETVRPRVLVIESVAEALDAGDVEAAWEEASSNRIDLNFLIDWRWPAALERVPALVDALDDVDLADLVSSLRDASTLDDLEAGYGDVPCVADAKRQGASEGAAAVPAIASARPDGLQSDGDVPRAGKNPYARGGVGAAPTATGKAATVCCAVAGELEGREDKPWYLRSRLACRVALGDVEGALLEIAAAREREVDAAETAAADADRVDRLPALLRGELRARQGRPPPRAEEGLKYLVLTQREETLYRAALGLYRLDLAYLVVSHAQELDPAEATHELRGLAAIPSESLRRYAIDERLGRYELALGHLVDAGPEHFTEALDLAKKRGLLRQFLAMQREGRGEPGATAGERVATCRQGPVDAQPPSARERSVDAHAPPPSEAAGGPAAASATQRASGLGGLSVLPEAASCAPSAAERRAMALRAYADDLSTRRRFEDAGLALLAANDPGAAADAYAAGLSWQAALAAAARARRSRSEIDGMARELAADLASATRVKEAAQLLLEHLADEDGAVRVLAEGNAWREAARVALARGRPDLLDSLVAPRAAARTAEMLEDFDDTRERLAKYTARLLELRQRRHAMQAALAARREAGDGGSDSDLEDDADGTASVVTGVSTVGGMSAYSVATTTATGTTAITSVSASTAGGRKAARNFAKKAERRARKAARRGRVRQGSPVEEEALCRHLLTLRPSVGALEEVGALAELLVLLGAESDARRLQAAASVALSEADKAASEVLFEPPPAQPGAAVSPADEFRERVARDRAESGKIEWKWDLLRD